MDIRKLIAISGMFVSFLASSAAFADERQLVAMPGLTESHCSWGGWFRVYGAGPTVIIMHNILSCNGEEAARQVEVSYTGGQHCYVNASEGYEVENPACETYEVYELDPIIIGTGVVAAGSPFFLAQGCYWSDWVDLPPNPYIRLLMKERTLSCSGVNVIEQSEYQFQFNAPGCTFSAPSTGYSIEKTDGSCSDYVIKRD